MSKSTHIKNIIFILILVLIVAGAIIGYKVIVNNQNAQKAEAVSDTDTGTTSIIGALLPVEPSTAADFTVLNEAGESVRLADYVGYPVILNFWVSWCGPCQLEVYDFENMYVKYGNEVQFMMINETDGTTETKDTAREYIEKHNLTFPVFYDTEGTAMKAYSIRSFPQTYFIDRDGNVTARIIGTASESAIEEGIEMIK